MIETPQKIEILKTGEHDIWGDPTISETIPVNGNLRSQTQIVRDDRGEEVVSNYTILFVGFVDISTDDKIRFIEPNNHVVETNPLQVKFMRDLDGSISFTKVVV